MCDTCKALVRVLARQSYFQEGVEVLKKSIDGEVPPHHHRALSVWVRLIHFLFSAKETLTKNKVSN